MKLGSCVYKGFTAIASCIEQGKQKEKTRKKVIRDYEIAPRKRRQRRRSSRLRSKCSTAVVAAMRASWGLPNTVCTLPRLLIVAIANNIVSNSIASLQMTRILQGRSMINASWTETIQWEFKIAWQLLGMFFFSKHAKSFIIWNLKNIIINQTNGEQNNKNVNNFRPLLIVHRKFRDFLKIERRFRARKYYRDYYVKRWKKFSLICKMKNKSSRSENRSKYSEG